MLAACAGACADGFAGAGACAGGVACFAGSGAAGACAAGCWFSWCMGCWCCLLCWCCCGAASAGVADDAATNTRSQTTNDTSSSRNPNMLWC